jgi:hypothetical protein
MTDQQENTHNTEPEGTEVVEEEIKPERFPQLAELEEKIHRRLRSNQRFLERFMDEDFDDLDDDEPDDIVVDDEPYPDEEL